jgi:hypothetical protein
MRKLIVLALLGTLAAFAVAAVAWANHPGDKSPNAESVTFVAGNPTCPANTVQGPKIDPGSNGSFGPVDVTGYDGKTFDWALKAAYLHIYDMAAVIVKGGPNANIFWYDYTAGGLDDSDTGLHSPVNHNNDKYFGISHIQFCLDAKGGGDN